MHTRRDRTPIVAGLETWILGSTERYDDFEEAVQSARSHDVAELDPILDLEAYLTYLDGTLTWIPSENSQGSAIFDRFAVVYFVLDQPSVIRYQSPIAPDQGLRSKTKQEEEEQQQPDAETTLPPPSPTHQTTQHSLQPQPHSRTPHHHPQPPQIPRLSWLSAWLIRFGLAIGTFMDTSHSLTPHSLSTFRSLPSFRISEYLEPRGSWRTFNSFFARRFKPGLRPIASIGDPSIIVSPADWTFNGVLPISESATVRIKSLTWRIGELLEGLGNATQGEGKGDKDEVVRRFEGGCWIHGYLGTADYHRVHAPCAGVVREKRDVMGQHYAQIEAVEAEEVDERAEHGATTATAVMQQQEEDRDREDRSQDQNLQSQSQSQQKEDDADVAITTTKERPPHHHNHHHDEKTDRSKKKRLHKRRIFSAPNDTGYQFVQRRGLVLLDTPSQGLVCVIPVGMSVVSSVVLTAEAGASLHKGEEIGYFQFGGSDIVVLFEKGPAEVKFTAEVGRHYKMGERIGHYVEVES